MVAYPIPKRLKLALTPAFACLVGGAVALACMLVPSAILEAAILDSGIPALLPAAAPPLGWTARTALAIITGGGAAAAAWLTAFLVLGGEGVVTIAPRLPSLTIPRFSLPRVKLPEVPLPRLKMPRLKMPRLEMPAFAKARKASTDDTPVPVLRRADAHPDAPSRAPLLALRDLGVPFLDIRAAKTPPVECDLPHDLDAPLSAFDPDAIPEVPADPIPTVPPLQPIRNSAIHEAGERFESFELHPPVPQPLIQPPIAAPRTDATIHALLDRLERGVGSRTPSDPTPGGVDDALSELRRLATR